MNYLHWSIEVIFFFCFCVGWCLKSFLFDTWCPPTDPSVKWLSIFDCQRKNACSKKKKSYPDKGFSKLQTRQLNGQLFIVALAPFSRSGDSKSIPSILVGSRKEDSTPVFYVVVAWSWVFCQIWVQIPKITERKFEQKLSS